MLGDHQTAPEALRAEARAPFSKLIDQALAKKNELLDWRQILYSLLLASEELEPLRQRLVAWFGDASEVEDRKWGRALAFLYAERGELEQAVGVLEKLAKELSYDEWQRVADLYLLLDRRADSEGECESEYDSTDEKDDDDMEREARERHCDLG